MYAPQSRTGFVIEPLFNDRLVMVSSQKDEKPVIGKRYVLVDWGPAFLAGHSQAFPDFATPAVSVSIGVLGLAYVLENGGTAYFPIRVAPRTSRRSGFIWWLRPPVSAALSMRSIPRPRRRSRSSRRCWAACATWPRRRRRSPRNNANGEARASCGSSVLLGRAAPKMAPCPSPGMKSACTRMAQPLSA